MAVAKQALAVGIAAALGTVAMAVAPPMTVRFQLTGHGAAEVAVLPFAVLAMALISAGLVARLLFSVSPWVLGPSTVLLLLIWCAVAPFVGEDAADYRDKWYLLVAVAAAASVPGTIGACLGELAARWRRRRQVA